MNCPINKHNLYEITVGMFTVSPYRKLINTSPHEDWFKVLLIPGVWNQRNALFCDKAFRHRYGI